MKHLILWGSFAIALFLLDLLWGKTSVATKFFDDAYTCPIYANAIFCLIAIIVLATRGYALIVQIFK